MRQQSGSPVEESRTDERYFRVAAPRGGGFAVRRSSTELLKKVDAVVFDCDGVLVDARESYDATIRVVVETMVEELTGVKLSLTRAIPRLISTMRRTGGFNSDWDTSYALTLFSVVALKGRGGARAGAVEALASVTAGFGSAPRGRGQEAVDSFLAKEFPSLQDGLDRAREFLGYPVTPPEGRMATLFDELYFGASLFKKVHGVSARKPRAKGLIDLERTLVRKKTLEALAETFDARLAIVTGRPLLGTEYSLGREVMGYFDKAGSMFVGDADVDLSLRAEYDGYRKPSPDALVRAKERLSSETLLYVGDSAEDLMMVQAARRRGLTGFLFAGVYETSPVRADQASFFEREASDVVLGTVNQVPSGLLLSSKGEGTRA